MDMDTVLQNDPQAISSGHRNGGQVFNSNPVSSLFRIRGGSKPFREMDRSDMEKFEVDLPKPKGVALSSKSSVPPHLLMTALLEQLCHMHVPHDKDLANKVFMLLCENLSKLNVISSLSHLDEMRHLRKQHGTTFKRLMGAALHSIKQSQLARALPGLGSVPNPIPSKGEKILLQEELMNEFSSRYEEEFMELDHLGKGGFGSVYKVQNNLDKRYYAIKKIRFKQKNHELLHKLLREVRVLANLQHNNIVGYNSAWIESHNPFCSSKATSSENTASQGISITNSPRDKKTNNESQSIEFLSDSESYISQKPASPRMSLQCGARFFSQSTLIKTHLQTKNVSSTSSAISTTTFHQRDATVAMKDERFNLFDFNQYCKITDITELSSSQYSSSSFASSVEELGQSYKSDSFNQDCAPNRKLEKSSNSVTDIISYDDNDFMNGKDNNDKAPDLQRMKQAVKRNHFEMNNFPVQDFTNFESTTTCKPIENEDEESHMSSTGFSVSNSNSRQISVASDVCSDIPNTLPNFLQTLDSKSNDYLSSYFDDIPSDNFAQKTQDLPLFQRDSFMDSSEASITDKAMDCCHQSCEDQPQAISPILSTCGKNISYSNQKPSLKISPSCADNEGITDVNTNHEANGFSNQHKDSSQNCLPLVPLQGRFHFNALQRCGSYAGKEMKPHSYDDVLDKDAWDKEMKDGGKMFLQPPRFCRSISNIEGIKYRGGGESKDHSYDFQNSIVLYIQMELCFQTLCEWIVKRNETIDLKSTYHDSLCRNNMMIFRQLLEGVNFIHSKGLIHRDLKSARPHGDPLVQLWYFQSFHKTVDSQAFEFIADKPRNIFLSEENFQVKIGDFGLAKEEVLNDAKDCFNLYSDWMTDGDSLNGRHTTGVGTTGYAAPEQIKGSVYDAKSDMYSLGVVMFEIFNVFKTDMERTENIKNPSQSSCLPDIQRQWPRQADAICRLTHENPEQRPLACDLLKGELFLTQEQEIKALKQTIVEKDILIESLKKTIKSLKADNEELLGALTF